MPHIQDHLNFTESFRSWNRKKIEVNQNKDENLPTTTSITTTTNNGYSSMPANQTLKAKWLARRIATRWLTS